MSFRSNHVKKLADGKDAVSSIHVGMIGGDIRGRTLRNIRTDRELGDER